MRPRQSRLELNGLVKADERLRVPSRGREHDALVQMDLGNVRRGEQDLVVARCRLRVLALGLQLLRLGCPFLGVAGLAHQKRVRARNRRWGGGVGRAATCARKRSGYENIYPLATQRVRLVPFVVVKLCSRCSCAPDVQEPVQEPVYAMATAVVVAHFKKPDLGFISPQPKTGLAFCRFSVRTCKNRHPPLSIQQAPAGPMPPKPAKLAQLEDEEFDDLEEEEESTANNDNNKQTQAPRLRGAKRRKLLVPTKKKVAELRFKYSVKAQASLDEPGQAVNKDYEEYFRPIFGPAAFPLIVAALSVHDTSGGRLGNASGVVAARVLWTQAMSKSSSVANKSVLNLRHVYEQPWLGEEFLSQCHVSIFTLQTSPLDKVKPASLAELCVTKGRIEDGIPKFLFDGALVQAPSSLDGLFRHHPGLWQKWKSSRAACLPPVQLLYLLQAIRHTKIDGFIVYIVASLNPVETIDVIDGLQVGYFVLQIF